MADSYVCSGAMMKCTMGSSPARLTVLPSRTVFLAGQPQANISDHKSMVNLAPFGVCRSLAFPPTAAATAAAHGHLTPMPCVHNTPAPWFVGKMDTLIKGQPALLQSCKCQCMWGGTISLINNGQVAIGAQGVNEKPKASLPVFKNTKQAERKVVRLEPGNKGNWNKELNKRPDPNTDYLVGDKVYKTDETGRVRSVSGKISLKKADRNPYQQRISVELKDGKKGIDDGGHLIAAIFGGAGEQINYVPMLGGKINRGQWRNMERRWEKALKQVPPPEVEIDIRILYKPNSKRPIGFVCQYKIGVKPYREVFKNYDISKNNK